MEGGRYRRVVLATDGSDDARRAAEFLAALEWPAESAVSVVGVCEATVPAASSTLPDTGVAQDARRYLELVQKEARQRTERFVAEAASLLRQRRPGITIEEVVRYGEPANALMAYLRESRAELAVAGARGHSVVYDLLLGSVSEGLVTEAPCPVVIVRDHPWPDMGGTVLVAAGRHDDVGRLAGAVLRLPMSGGTRVVVAAVKAVLVPDPAAEMEAGQPVAPGAAEVLAGRLRAAAPGWSVETCVLTGDVAGELMRKATELTADLIAIGARERGGLIGWLGLGSVARKLVRRAGCSVLVVRGRASGDRRVDQA
jgi:nucleotide-binding universal stress UspA family protein